MKAGTLIYGTVMVMSLLIVDKVFAGDKKITVSKDGKGDFTTLQEAINSLPDSAATPRTIYLKKGTYNEKIYLKKSNIIIEGEDMNAVILEQAIARDEWRCLHPDDWGVATLNIEGNDLTFKNLTIVNTFGFDHTSEVVVECAGDTVNHKKTIRPDGHQMAVRTFRSTRLKFINCRMKAFGGDTVSPWDVREGMYYFKDCIMEGGVDFYCPRGWAYAENCTFISHTGPAAIWHDGSGNADSKTVLKHCTFTGYDGFKLGRYHRDAQFYLVDCSFAENMADTDIYQVATNNVLQWGRRIYYYNCHRNGKDFPWYADNLSAAPGSPKVADINAGWVFKGRWEPGN